MKKALSGFFLVRHSHPSSTILEILYCAGKLFNSLIVIREILGFITVTVVVDIIGIAAFGGISGDEHDRCLSIRCLAFR